jgi:nitrous oxidase accessory protein
MLRHSTGPACAPASPVRPDALRVVVAFFAVLTVASVAGPVESAVATTIEVRPTDGAMARAVAGAAPHDTLLLHPGTYRESGIVVDRPLVLVGLPGAVLDVGGGKADGLVLVADSVVVSGLEVTGVGADYLGDAAAIRIRERRDCTIRGTTIRECFFGIYLEKVAACTLDGNRILNSGRLEALSGNAIHVWKADSLVVRDNEVVGHRDGIYLEFARDSRIDGNVSRGNLRYGLHFMFSDRSRYEGNVFTENGTGVAVMFSRGIQMIDNTFERNWGGSTYSLLLKEISDGSIERNRFVRNTTAIHAEGATRLLIRGNRFVDNGTAMNVMGNCLDNTVTGNVLENNVFEIVTNSRHTTNSYDGNYWSGYRGYDLDRDGVGDVPYRPVNVFARVVDRVPAATIVLNSALVDLLVLIERTFPTIIPEGLIDRRPLVRPEQP